MQTNAIDLTGRVAIVTGGAQGIGLTVGHRLLASGAKLVVWDINEATPEQASADLNAVGKGAVHTEKVDIADYDSVAAAMAGTLERISIREVFPHCQPTRIFVFLTDCMTGV